MAARGAGSDEATVVVVAPEVVAVEVSSVRGDTMAAEDEAGGIGRREEDWEAASPSAVGNIF